MQPQLFLFGCARRRPAEFSRLKPFCRAPETAPVEIQHLDSCARPVGKDKQRFPVERLLQLPQHQFAQSLKALAQILRLKRHEDLQRSRSQADHSCTPFRRGASASRPRALSRRAASSTDSSSTISRRPPSTSMTIRVEQTLRGASNSTSMKRTSVTRPNPRFPRDVDLDLLDISPPYPSPTR